MITPLLPELALLLIGAANPANPLDTQGEEIKLKVGTKPAKVTMSWTLQENVPAGKYVRVLANGLQQIALYRGESVTVTVGGVERQVPIAYRYSPEEQKKDWMFYVRNPFVVAVKLDQELPAGSGFNVSGNFKGTTFPGKHLRYRLESSDSWNGPWKPLTGWNILSLEPLEAASLEAHQRANGRLQVLYTDKFGNPTSPGTRKLKVLSADGKELFKAEIDNQPAVTLTSPDGVKLPERVKVKDDMGMETLASARPSPAFDGSHTYFGEIHWHSEFSGDGYRPLSECLEYARDQLGLDFATPGDHYPAKLDEYFKVTDSYNTPGKFTTILGYEMSLGSGHINIYYRDRKSADKWPKVWQDYVSKQHHIPPNKSVIKPLCEPFEPEEVLMIPHHMNITSGTVEKVVSPEGFALWRQFDWRDVDDRYIPVAEMTQMRGSFETEEVDKDWRMISGGYGSSVRTALAMGHRFGFIGGTDNHDGWPTRGCYGVEGGYSQPTVYIGLAAVQAPELTREAIFNSLRQRRCYATSGARIVLDFVLNGKYPMGSEAKLTSREPRKFHIVIKGTAPLERVEVISQGAKLASIPVDGSTDLEIDWSEPRADKPLDNCYYYIRVRQTDGHCAWSSPIWVDYAK